jgi:transposase
MEILSTNCAVHKKTVKGCLLTPGSNGRPHKEFRTYSTTIEELLNLSDWLHEQGCTHVAEDRNGCVLETTL